MQKEYNIDYEKGKARAQTNAGILCQGMINLDFITHSKTAREGSQ